MPSEYRDQPPGLSAHSLGLRTTLDQHGTVLAKSSHHRAALRRTVACTSVRMRQTGALVLSWKSAVGS